MKLLSLYPFLLAFFTTSLGNEVSFSSLNIESKVRLRYAITEVTAVMENPSGLGQEVNFTMVIPDTAFISNFTMNVNGKLEVAEVKEKEEAKKKYTQAKTLGLSSGLVHRNSNKFTVSTFVEEGKKAEFYLMYEEMLTQGADSNYHHDIKIFPEGDVEQIRVFVEIDESLPLSHLKVPPLMANSNLRLQQQGPVPLDENEPDAFIDHIPGSSKATVEYLPSSSPSGILSIQYDVDRKKQVNEIQVIDGYFVHFFNSDVFRKLPVHVVFVLDVSGSMSGNKIEQLKSAMIQILDDLEDHDYFSIITFSSHVTPWDFDIKANGLFRSTVSIKDEAMNYISTLNAGGGTSLNAALMEGLTFLNSAKFSKVMPKDTSSMMIFLTDGQPTDVTDKTVILKNVENNNYNKLPIFGLAFGQDADFDFIKQISHSTDSFAQRIYDDSDADLQLEHFFTSISRPVLENIKFTYQGVEETSQATKAQVFKGKETVVVGKLDPSATQLNMSVTADNLLGKEGYKAKDTICTSNDISSKCNTPDPVTFTLPSGFMQRYYAYKTIKELVKDADEWSLERALELSLDNNFVTELTSLVVTDSSFSLNQTLYKKEEVSHWIGGGNSEPTTTVAPCRLILFSDQRFRGESVEIDRDISDLSALGFNDRVSSLKVVGSGSCSWTLYSEVDFTGKTLVVTSKRSFSRRTSLRQLLKKAKSAKMN